jgi:hypothetical protein
VLCARKVFAIKKVFALRRRQRRFLLLSMDDEAAELVLWPVGLAGAGGLTAALIGA